MTREFPDFKNDIIGGLLASQPGQFADVARLGNTLASQPPNPLVLIRQLGLDSRKVYLFRTAKGGEPIGREIQYPGDATEFNDTDDRFLSGRSSAFGTPVVCNMFIGAPKHTNPSTGVTLPAASIFMDLVVCEVSQERNIVVTPVNGRDGTVKEYISDGDYAIGMKGKIVGTGYLYPVAAVQNLLKVCRAKIAVDVESPYLREVFGITRMVIASYRLWQEEGIEGEQMFEITALSESALETELASI